MVPGPTNEILTWNYFGNKVPVNFHLLTIINYILRKTETVPDTQGLACYSQLSLDVLLLKVISHNISIRGGHSVMVTVMTKIRPLHNTSKQRKMHKPCLNHKNDQTPPQFWLIGVTAAFLSITVLSLTLVFPPFRQARLRYLITTTPASW